MLTLDALCDLVLALQMKDVITETERAIIDAERDIQSAETDVRRSICCWFCLQVSDVRDLTPIARVCRSKDKASAKQSSRTN